MTTMVAQLTPYEFLSLLTALLAIVVSFVSLYRTYRISKRQLELQEGQLELEKEQASLAKMQREQLEEAKRFEQSANVGIYLAKSVEGYRFYVRNGGPAIAFDVDVQITSKATGESMLIKDDYEAKFPAKKLLPEREINLLAPITLDSGSVFSCDLTWHDQSGGVKQRKDELSI